MSDSSDYYYSDGDDEADGGQNLTSRSNPYAEYSLNEEQSSPNPNAPSSSINPFADYSIPDEHAEPDGGIDGSSSFISRFKDLDLASCFEGISEESRREIYAISDPEDRLHIAQAIPAFRICTFDRTVFDFSYRNVDQELFAEIMNTEVACDAAHASFSQRLNISEALGGLPSFLQALNLTGALIDSSTLRVILTETFQMKILILNGLFLEQEVFELANPLQHLRSLSLAGSSGLCSVQFLRQMISAIPNVVNLDLSNCDISNEGMALFVEIVNPELKVLDLADLGWRFDLPHLLVLTTRCTIIESLNVSDTRAAHFLNHVHYVPFRKLQELNVQMTEPYHSPVSGQVLQDLVEHIPWLKALYFYRRITDEEIVRYAPWEMPFRCVRYWKSSWDGNPLREFEKLFSELINGQFPSAQLSNRRYAGFRGPLD